jgi:hypothetical protein
MNKLNYPIWLVPLDIAQELKGIGFDEPCTFAIDYTQLIEPFLVQYCNKGYNAVFCGEMKNLTYKTLDKNLLDKIAIIPTWDDSLAWFRARGYKIAFKDINIGTQCAFYHLDIREGHTFSHFAKKYEKAREALVMKLIEVHKEFGNNIKRK